MTTRPIVVVIENPQDDPDVYANPTEVEVIELSRYLLTHWADSDPLANRIDDLTTMLEEVEGLLKERDVQGEVRDGLNSFAADITAMLVILKNDLKQWGRVK